jgi:hypothetical protein
MSHVPCPWEGQILCQGRQAPGPPFWRVSRLNLPGLETNTSTYQADLAGFEGVNSMPEEFLKMSQNPTRTHHFIGHY